MTKTPIPKGLRRRVFERDGYTCRYCGASGEGVSFHADHVYPESKGGETTLNNLATACAGCNHKKYTSVGMWPKPIGYFDAKKREGDRRDALIGRHRTVLPYIVLSIGSIISSISFFFMLYPGLYDISAAFLIVGLVIFFTGYGMTKYQTKSITDIMEEYDER